MGEAFLVALGAVIGSAGTVLFDRTWRWRRPKVSAEAGNLARRSVNSARRVFSAATALGGGLAYPWELDGESLREDRLADDLRQAAARVNSKEFSAQVQGITTALRGVFAAQPSDGPGVFIIGDQRPESASERELRESNERKAVKQREHADAGIALIEPSLALLDKLERHS